MNKIVLQKIQGNVIPTHEQLTIQQAANILNVSRSYLVNLLEQCKIPFHKVGTKRRIYVKNLLSYKENTEQERLKMLEELTNQAQKLNMGY